MRRVFINYKSGHTVHIDYTDNVSVTTKGERITGIDVDGSIGGQQPLFWGMEDIESVVIESVGWQRVVEYIARLTLRFWYKVTGR